MESPSLTRNSVQLETNEATSTEETKDNNANGAGLLTNLILVTRTIALIVGVVVFATLHYIVLNHPRRSSHPNTVINTAAVTSGILHVEGNRLVDSAGNLVILRGAQIESAFNVAHPSPAERQATDHLNSETFAIMHNDWHMNVLRLPICDYLWEADKIGYITRLQQVVSDANRAGLYVILDLDSDQHCGAPHTNSMLKMPYLHSLTFWRAIASTFDNSPMVIFDAFDEPHTLLSDDWSSWLHGGRFHGHRYVGMQDIVQTIRQQGAKQPIVVESLPDRNGLDAIGNYLINDPNIIYSWHLYFSESIERTPADWDRLFGDFSLSHAVLIGEWAFLPNAPQATYCKGISNNGGTLLVEDFLLYMQQHNLNWVAWSFEPGYLIVNYNSYSPTSLRTAWKCGQETPGAGDGELIKLYLANQH